MRKTTPQILSLCLALLLMLCGCQSGYEVQTALFSVTFPDSVSLSMETLSYEGVKLETGSYVLKQRNSTHYGVATVDYQPLIDWLWEEHTQSITARDMVNEAAAKQSVQAQGGVVSHSSMGEFAGQDAAVVELSGYDGKQGYGRVYTLAYDNAICISIMYFAPDSVFYEEDMQQFFDSFSLNGV
ncbi:hypothetical protein LJC55_02375 [Eubacteriales bacterium OttesenSCG-928-N14]|nr:hypothetical protein [Eubacteriales bacterium OttesenSCG-928-N14]